MVNIKINYNPYLVETQISMDGAIINTNSAIMKRCKGRRLQEWIESFEDEATSFFEQLSEHANLKGTDVNFEFAGTKFDYYDFSERLRKETPKFNLKGISHCEILEDSDSKIVELKKIIDEIKEKNLAELNDKKFRSIFEAGIAPTFEIMIVAPMSSGKSTLLNTLIGKNLLPVAETATTNIVTKIVNDNAFDEFRVTAIMADGKIKKQADNIIATYQNIAELNKDPGLRELIIRGKLRYFNDMKINLTFIDTPGGNNIQNEEHKKVMLEAIREENKNVVLYIFSGSNVTGEDGCNIVKEISKAMKATQGRQQKDRFLFVANKMDMYTEDKDSIEVAIKQIKELLAKDEISIINPNLFIVSAFACNLARRQNELTVSEGEDMDKFRKRFKRKFYKFTQYASIPESQKKQFDAYVDKALEKNDDAAVVEINSGIPALEWTIKQYLEKYALPIKIKTVVDSYNKKVEAMNLSARLISQAQNSEEACEALNREVLEKQESLEKSNKAKNFKDRIEQLRMEKNLELNALNDIQDIMSNIKKEYSGQIKKEEAGKIIEEFQSDITVKIEDLQKKIEREINEEINKKLNAIFKEYEAYLCEMFEAGYFSIGKFSIRESIIEQIQITGLQNHEFLEKEKSGEKRVKKEGVGAFFTRRIFNPIGFFDWGYEYEIIYKDVKMINVDDLIANELSKIQTEATANIKIIYQDCENEITKKQNIAKEKLRTIEEKIKDQLVDVEQKTMDYETAKLNMAKAEENIKWVENLSIKMESLLRK